MAKRKADPPAPPAGDVDEDVAQLVGVGTVIGISETKIRPRKRREIGFLAAHRPARKKRKAPASAGDPS
ncbi:MAG: hypothetical protein WA208_13415 [Thermoanaerobaculia bacterium]